MKPTLTLLTALLLAPLAALHAADTPKPGAKPNFVFILVDDMPYAGPSGTGNTMLQTPYLDRCDGRESKVLAEISVLTRLIDSFFIDPHP